MACPAGVEPAVFGVGVQRIIHCATGSFPNIASLFYHKIKIFASFFYTSESQKFPSFILTFPKIKGILKLNN